VLPGGPVLFRIEGRRARLNREITGPVVAELGGVPARPVDSFTWDGVGSRYVDGEIVIEVDAVSERGIVEARWTDEHGTWTYQQAVLYHPHHSSGVRAGASLMERQVLINEGAIANVYLHGDTGAGVPVLPTVFTYLGAWGPALVTLNGEPFENVYGIPSPLWEGHLMVTEGARGDDGTVRRTDGRIYSMMDGARGAVDPHDLEVHLTWHDNRFPVVSDNVPPLFDFFYHLVFEDVTMEILEVDEAPPPSPLEGALVDRRGYPSPERGAAGGEPGAMIYAVTATTASTTRRTTGEVTSSIRGVPAAPVDSLSHDGRGVRAVPGELQLEADPSTGRAAAVVRWLDEHGSWELRHRAAPASDGKNSERGAPNGVRFAPSSNERTELHAPVVANAYAFGDSGAGPGVLPTLFAYLVSTGEAEVFLNGVPFLNELDAGGVGWRSRIAVTEGARDEAGLVRTLRGATFDPSRPADGLRDRYDLEVQVTFEDAPGGDAPRNVPTGHAFSYSLVFEDVRIEIGQIENVRTVGR
jgi:hypothetical protein